MADDNFITPILIQNRSDLSCNHLYVDDQNVWIETKVCTSVRYGLDFEHTKYVMVFIFKGYHWTGGYWFQNVLE